MSELLRSIDLASSQYFLSKRLLSPTPRACSEEFHESNMEALQGHKVRRREYRVGSRVPKACGSFSTNHAPDSSLLFREEGTFCAFAAKQVPVQDRRSEVGSTLEITLLRN